MVLLQLNLDKLQMQIGGEKLSNLVICVSIIVGALLLKKPLAWLMAKVIANLTNRFSDKSHAKMLRGILQRPFELLLQTILFYVAINQLNVLLSGFLLHRIINKHEELAVRISDLVDHVFILFIIFYTVLLIAGIIDFIYQIQKQRAQEEYNRERQQLLPIVKDVAKVVIWTIGLFSILGLVFHVNIPALVAGLGIGGVAIASAAKESVENLFAAFTILTDKPFQVDDKVKLGTLEGRIERIGFRSTRLRSSDGSAFIIPNKKLVNETLENLTNRTSRRIKLIANIQYGIPHDKLTQLTSDIKTALLASEHVTEPVEIILETFAENTLQLTIMYHIAVPLADDISVSSIKHTVNMLIYKLIEPYAVDDTVYKLITTSKTGLEETDSAEQKEADDSIG